MGILFGTFELVGSLELPGTLEMFGTLETFGAFETFVVLETFGSLETVGTSGVVGNCLPGFPFDPPFCPLPCGVAPTTANIKLMLSKAAKGALFATTIFGFIEVTSGSEYRLQGRSVAIFRRGPPRQ